MTKPATDHEPRLMLHVQSTFYSFGLNFTVAAAKRHFALGKIENMGRRILLAGKTGEEGHHHFLL
jgi:hypothetical protein